MLDLATLQELAAKPENAAHLRLRQMGIRLEGGTPLAAVTTNTTPGSVADSADAASAGLQPPGSPACWQPNAPAAAPSLPRPTDSADEAGGFASLLAAWSSAEALFPSQEVVSIGSGSDA
eukprot:CAMPEP_0195610440 /NCGR_PEP_ID=MMETSP0815-20121206/9812_1 /TAXON_ID=97485 /ORGANISM="Prymnesium parvum, Strain Texoma1" /LENGTH=119 /DNA_ID=CAMNT_0040750433 /DNA_START=193 /DNA_END=550 /DNA_ORIENTATION=+